MPEVFHVERLRNHAAKTTCSKCAAECENRSNSYCRSCKATYMRNYRPRHKANLLTLRYENERLKQKIEEAQNGQTLVRGQDSVGS